MIALWAWLGMAQAGSLELLLHAPGDAPAPLDQCTVNLCTSLLGLIQRAESRIDFAIYGLRGQTEVLNALEAAKARGVTVRGVVDRDVAYKNYYSGTDTMIQLLGNVRDDYDVDAAKARRGEREQSEPWCERPPGLQGPLQCLGFDLGSTCLVAVHATEEALSFQGDIMHDKFFVVDGRYVWTGSTNVSDSCAGGYNANLVTVVDSPEVAALYQEEFEMMYRDGRFHDRKSSNGKESIDLGGGVKVDVLFSPQDKPITNGVRPLLQRATSQIDIAVFFLTHKGITEDLIQAHQRGVKIRVILDATAATNGYTKHELLRVAGIPVKIENWGGKMHAKSAVIDGQVVITGSMNWTSAGEGGNDENTLIVHSATHAAQYSAWFEDVWKSIPDRWLQGRPDPESKDSGTACTDGVDNDYDHTKDGDDPGCSTSPPPLSELPPHRVVAKEEGQGLLKAYVDGDGRKVFVAPTDRAYTSLALTPDNQGVFLCGEQQAKALGYWPAKD